MHPAEASLGGARFERTQALAGWIGRDAALTDGPGEPALAGRALLARIESAAALLSNAFPPDSAIGLLADNSPAWLLVDLAAHGSGHRLIPLPAFFTPAQRMHAVKGCGMQGLVCEDEEAARALGFERPLGRVEGLQLFGTGAKATAAASSRSAASAQKITYTSGTTGEPKGVALTSALQRETAQALALRLAPLRIERHLSLLPFPLLLENVAGAYTALRLGAACICPPLDRVGVAGSVGFDPDRCLQTIGELAPHSLILLPQMLRLLVERLEHAAGRDPRVASLRFVAVGGAKTPLSVLRRARALGLPVYEGYGLSECASVVSLNVPGEDRPGSVGKPLPCVSIRMSAAGELEVGRGYAAGACLRGPAGAWVATGDLGAVDQDGFVHVHGRRSNVLVTAFGRNVSPEWPESLLLDHPALAQAVVFGDARPSLVAVLVARTAGIGEDALRSAVDRANALLPDYARIDGWLRAAEPFAHANGLATANGRVRRMAVEARYADAIDALYEAPRSERKNQ